MGVLGAVDINEMLADQLAMGSAVEVTLGSTKVTGLFDRAAVQFFDGDAPTLIAEGEAVHIKAGSLPGLRPGSAITIESDGVSTNHSVIRILSYGDGAMQRVALALA